MQMVVVTINYALFKEVTAGLNLISTPTLCTSRRYPKIALLIKPKQDSSLWKACIMIQLHAFYVYIYIYMFNAALAPPAAASTEERYTKNF